MAIKKKTRKNPARKRTISKRKDVKNTTRTKVAIKKTVKKRAVKKIKPAKKVITRKETTKSKERKTAAKKSSGARMVINSKKTAIKKIKSKNNQYMNNEQLDYFRSLLMQWKEELMREVDRTMDHMKADAMNFADPTDRATQEEEFSLELRARDRGRKLIKKIDRSLKYIDKKDYGYCNFCGAEIGYERLKARPTASMCIDCKTLQEYQEKQIGSS